MLSSMASIRASSRLYRAVAATSVAPSVPPPRPAPTARTQSTSAGFGGRSPAAAAAAAAREADNGWAARVVAGIAAAGLAGAALAAATSSSSSCEGQATMSMKVTKNVHVPAANTPTPDDGGEFRAGEYKKGMKNYRLSEIEKHNNPEDSAWVIYRNGVYDVTEFIESHPGGEKIKLAVGKRIDPFWRIFQQHRAEHVQQVIEELRIGNLDPRDAEDESADSDENDPYFHDPKDQRSPVLQVRSQKPFCAEPPVMLVAEEITTPTELHYIRCHLPVPLVEPEDYVLEVETPAGTQRVSLKELKENYEPVEVTSTLQCIGNRVQAAKKEKQVGTFMGTAIGNSVWKGARLREVLRRAGVERDSTSAGTRINWVHIEALDKDPIGGEPYGGCLPMEKAFSCVGDVILAYEMNGEDIPRDHGYPVRLIVPGWAGVRNVKWVNKVVAAADESKNTWYTSDVKNVGQRIMEWPVQSYITGYPGQVEDWEETVELKGYAYSGGGRRIARVEVSTDGGKTWTQADLDQIDQPQYKSWAWTLWSAEVPMPKKHPGGKLEVVCRAVDVSFNTQPPQILEQEFIDYGIVNNSWHRVDVDIDPRP